MEDCSPEKKTRVYLGRSATVMYTINLISVDITYCISEELAKARGLFGFGKLQQGDLFFCLSGLRKLYQNNTKTKMPHNTI